MSPEVAGNSGAAAPTALRAVRVDLTHTVGGRSSCPTSRSRSPARRSRTPSESRTCAPRTLNPQVDLAVLRELVQAGCGYGRVCSVAARGSPRVRSVNVSVVPLAVAAWGVVRPGGRRLRACRRSRGRRPSGSDSEATGPLVVPLRRHLSGVGGRLTQTRLRHAFRLQRPCSLPCCSCYSSIVGGGHPPQLLVADSTARMLPDRAARNRRAGWGTAPHAMSMPRRLRSDRRPRLRVKADPRKMRRRGSRRAPIGANPAVRYRDCLCAFRTATGPERRRGRDKHCATLLRPSQRGSRRHDPSGHVVRACGGRDRRG